MFIFRSGKNYGSYTVTELLPAPLRGDPGKKVSFRERFQHAFQEVDDVYVVRDDSFQYSTGTAALLSSEYGEIIEKLETNASRPQTVGEAGEEPSEEALSEQTATAEEKGDKTNKTAEKAKADQMDRTHERTVEDKWDGNLARASWEEMDMRERECQAVEEHSTQVRGSFRQSRSMAHRCEGVSGSRGAWHKGERECQIVEVHSTQVRGSVRLSRSIAHR